MKLLFVILIFVASAFQFTLNAQNWSPVSMGNTYHYSCDTTNTIFSLWADSMQVNGPDTTYYLNRVILPCDTCIFLQNSFGNNASFMVRNQPLFLRREFNVLNDGKFILLSPDTLVFDKNVLVGNSWTFDTFPNIDANVYFKGNGTVLGVSDSLMGVILNLTDTIIISKNHGVVQWPCVSGNYFKLIGVEGADTIGYHVPDSTEIFDFHVGDTFNYNDGEGWPYHIYYNDINLKIDSVFYIGIDKYYKIKFCGSGAIDDETFNIHDTWYLDGAVSNCQISLQECFNSGYFNTFSNIQYSICHRRSFQEIFYFQDYFSIFRLFFENSITVFEQLAPKFRSLSYYGFPNSLIDILVNTDPLERHHILIKEKEGLINAEEGFWEGGVGRNVTIYVLNGDTIIPSNVLCASWLDVVNSNYRSISVFPNPSNGVLNITGIEDGEIEIYSIMGEKIYSKKISEKYFDEFLQITLGENIHLGLYIVKIRTKNSSYCSKLIIQ